MTFRSTRTNRCPNPSVETNLTDVDAQAGGGWADGTWTRVSDWSSDGSWSVRYTGRITSAAGFVGVSAVAASSVAASPGEVWYGRCEAKVDDAVASGAGTFAWLRWYTSGGAVVGDGAYGPLSVFTTGVQSLEVIGSAPLTTAYVRLFVVSQSNTTNDTVDVHADAFVMERVATTASLTTTLSELPAASALSVYDEWSGDSDGALTVANTGHLWTRSQGGNGSAFVVDSHRATALTAVSGSSYAETNLREAVTMVKGSWVFGSCSDPTTAGVSIGGWTEPISGTLPAVPDTNLHIGITPDAWNIGYWESNAYTILVSRFFASDLATNGSTVHEITVVRQDDTVLIDLPDGNLEVVRHPKLDELAGGYAYFEVFGTFTTGSRGRWNEVGMSTEFFELGLEVPDANLRHQDDFLTTAGRGQ